MMSSVTVDGRIVIVLCRAFGMRFLTNCELSVVSNLSYRPLKS